MNAKITAIICSFLLIGIVSIVSIFISTKDLLSKLPNSANFYTRSQLFITTQNGSAEVKVDNKDAGSTPISEYAVNPGKHEILLTRTSSEDSFFTPVKIYIEIEDGTRSYMNVEILPNGKYAGYITYYSQSPDSDASKAFITVSTDIPTAVIELNGEEIGKDQVIVHEAQPGEAEVTIKAPGYEFQQFKVNVTAGYNLTVQASLMPIPIAF